MMSTENWVFSCFSIRIAQIFFARAYGARECILSFKGEKCAQNKLVVESMRSGYLRERGNDRIKPDDFHDSRSKSFKFFRSRLRYSRIRTFFHRGEVRSKWARSREQAFRIP